MFRRSFYINHAWQKTLIYYYTKMRVLIFHYCLHVHTDENCWINCSNVLYVHVYNFFHSFKITNIAVGVLKPTPGKFTRKSAHHTTWFNGLSTGSVKPPQMSLKKSVIFRDATLKLSTHQFSDYSGSSSGQKVHEFPEEIAITARFICGDRVSGDGTTENMWMKIIFFISSLMNAGNARQMARKSGDAGAPWVLTKGDASVLISRTWSFRSDECELRLLRLSWRTHTPALTVNY